MEKIKVNVLLEKNVESPFYATKGSSGMDIRANITKEIILKPLERIAVPTGIKLEIPEGYEIQVRPRSGLALKHGITLLNTPGTIDSDYRGELKIIIINCSNTCYAIKPNDRIAQIILQKVYKIDFNHVSSVKITKRNEGGFGHTGIK